MALVDGTELWFAALPKAAGGWRVAKCSTGDQLNLSQRFTVIDDVMGATALGASIAVSVTTGPAVSFDEGGMVDQQVYLLVSGTAV